MVVQHVVPQVLHILHKCLAARRDSAIVAEVGSALTKTAARERVPEQAPVRATVPVSVRLDPRVTACEQGRVARLDRERVEEEVEPDGVARRAGGVRARVGREAVLGHERAVDDVEDVRPDLADVVHLVEATDGRVAERVASRGRRVGV